MGKLVKFCSACDESFAERFGFCPNCGQTLQAFEMKPVVSETPAMEEPVVMPVPPLELESLTEPAEILADEPAKADSIDEPVLEIPMAAEPVDETPIIEKPKAKAAAAPVAPFVHAKAVDIDRKPVASDKAIANSVGEDGFHVTVIEEKNAGQRRVLLVGTLGAMVVVLMSGLVYSLFSKSLDVGSINDDIFNAVIVDDIPITIEEQLKEKKDKGGGGGGGGRDEKEELTKGDLADQTPKPVRAPDAKVPRLENPSLVLPPASTEGNRKFPKENDRFGDPNGRFTSFSNGTGSGGGQGTGVGTGQGSGRGTGAGSGTGSGSGGGLGSGNGDGRGDGDGDFSPPPPRPVGVTQSIKIISKPRPGYTDAARTANIQGTVILRVTFLASGQIGSISSVKGLPNGLTEQAIAAARRITFEPAKRDGVGQSVTKQIEYSFSIY